MMKTRILTGIIGTSLFCVVLVFYKFITLNILLSIVNVLALYEVLVATKLINNKPVSVISLIFSASVPFFSTPYYGFNIYSLVVCFVYIFSLFIILVLNHKSTKIEHVGYVFIISMLISFSLSCIAFVRDLPGQHGGFYILLLAIASWGSDTGAYFTGVYFGKHKMAPYISPKKTIEGLIGGFVFCFVAFILAGYVYQYAFVKDAAKVSIPLLALFSIPLSAASVFGDLTASLIKRTCDIKDFGNVLPGHGGILDRFDSMLFVGPMLYLFIHLFPIIT